jgi:hypothetical protein
MLSSTIQSLVAPRIYAQEGIFMPLNSETFVLEPVPFTTVTTRNRPSRITFLYYSYSRALYNVTESYPRAFLSRYRSHIAITLFRTIYPLSKIYMDGS